MIIDHTKHEERTKRQFQEQHQPLQSAVSFGKGKGYDYDGFTQDLFSCLYQVNPKIPGSEDKVPSGCEWAKKALNELNSLPEFKNMRKKDTMLDSVHSGLGATVLANAFLDSLPDMSDSPQSQQEALNNMEELEEMLNDPNISADQAQKLRDMLQRARDNAGKWEEAANNMDSGAVRQAFRRGIEQAQKATEEAEQAMYALGFGDEEGNPSLTSVQDHLAMFKMLASNPNLKKIVEMAGRLKSEAMMVQRNKKKPGPDELTGIDSGANLERTLPVELMKAKHPVLRYEFYRKFTEKSLLQYYMEDNTEKKKGPIIVLLDNSGSMLGNGGEINIWARAVALAMAHIAKHQKRNFVIFHFNTTVTRKDYFLNGKFDSKKLLESMAYFANGGTDFSCFVEAFNEVNNNPDFHKADVIVLTDDVYNSNDLKVKLEKAKQESESSLYSVLIKIGPGYKDGKTSLQEVSDKYIFLDDLAEDEGEIKDVLFSI